MARSSCPFATRRRFAARVPAMPGTHRFHLIALAVLAVAFVGPLVAHGAPRAQTSPSTLTFDHEGHATIPFDLRNHHLWIRGRVNGADSIWIVVDTGASSTVLDEGTARRLSIPLTGEREAHGAGGVQPSRDARDVTVELPGLKLHQAHMVAIDLSTLTQTGGRPMQLVLGY